MHASEPRSATRPLIAFGPVPSRRLGRSIGINHIPPKTCSYSCVYCQVGRTSRMQTARCRFYPVDEILADVEHRVAEARAAGARVDYLTFVPDGEPTLDRGLSEAIGRLKPLGVRIAVISNGSLLWRADVREALGEADWVSIKVDAVHEDVWHRINRPHRLLKLGEVLDGMLAFARAFRGELATETMLVRAVNDDAAHLADLAAFVSQLRPARAYLAAPTRPPAESWVEPPAEETLNRAFQLLDARLPGAELLIGYEGNAFSTTGDVTEDLLRITAVHPMRDEAVHELLRRAGAEVQTVDDLVAQGRLIEIPYEGHKFYLRRMREPRCNAAREEAALEQR